MAAVPDAGACKALCCNRTITARSFAGNGPPRNPHGRGPRSAQNEQFLHHCSDRPIRFVSYFASIQVSDPVSFTATFVMEMCRGLPSAVPRCSVETSRGPAFL